MEEKVLKNNKRKTRKAIIGYIISFLCLFLCIYIVLEVISANTNNRPPRIFGLSISYVPTESMKPEIEAGNYVLFAKTSYDSCKVDDIIVYYNTSENKYIIHRLIAKVENGEVVETSTRFSESDKITTSEKNYFIAKGDNNTLVDSIPVTNDIIYGKFVVVLGFMKIFAGGTNTNLIFIILIGIFVLMIALQAAQMILAKKAKEAKEENQKKLDEREKMLEELKKEILAEEYEKMKKEILEQETNNNKLEENDSNIDEEIKE